MTRTHFLMGFGLFLTALTFVACQDSFEDCTLTATCPPDPDGGSSGDGGGDSGGSGSGGATGGTGAGGSSTGGMGGEPFSCDLCTADGQVCDDTNEACVECLPTDASTCDALLPVCSAEMKCVECTAENLSACTTDEPVCSENECVECTPEQLQACAMGEVCSETNTCVACTTNEHCTDPSATVCNDNNECLPCESDTDCHLEGLGVCDEGTCVECTAEKFSSCGVDSEDTGKPFLCDALKKTCSSTDTEASSGLCEPCIANAQCVSGQACVLQTFQSWEVGYFCFWEKGAGGGAPISCSASSPYVNSRENAETIDGREADVCTLRATTCPGIQDFGDPAVSCAPEEDPQDELCGAEELNDGICRLFENVADPYPDIYRCSVPCVTVDDCPGDFGCNTSQGDGFCELTVN